MLTYLEQLSRCSPCLLLGGEKDRLIGQHVSFQKALKPFKPNLLPMNGSDLNSFPLEARKNKRVILENMALLFSEPRVRASRGK